MVAAWRSGGVPHGREALGWFFMQCLLLGNFPLVVHVEISLIVWDCPAVESNQSIDELRSWANDEETISLAWAARPSLAVMSNPFFRMP